MAKFVRFDTKNGTVFINPESVFRLSKNGQDETLIIPFGELNTGVLVEAPIGVVVAKLSRAGQYERR